MKTKIRLTAPTLTTRADAEDAMHRLRILTIARAKMDLDKQRAIAAIEENCRPELEKADQQLDALAEQLKAWADAHPETFGKLKSLQLTHGLIGYRTGTPKLKTLKGWDWDRVLAALQDGGALSDYIRRNPEVDKAKLLADRETLGRDLLALYGITVAQDEAFFADPIIGDPTA